MPANNEPTLFQNLVGIIQTVFLPVGVETLRLLPDSVVLGTALLAIVSLCKSYGILVLTMVELMCIQRLFATLLGGIAPLGAGYDALHQTCQPGFTFPNMMRISLLETIGKPSLFPSPVMFFLTGTLAYMVGSVKEFGREIKTLGGDLQTRTTVGVVLCSFLAFIVLAFRYSYGCESFGTLFISMLLGLVAGIALIFQNKALFGREGINVLNLPMILTATESGKPMFVCAPSGM
jgi:hypothetical protein